MAAASAVRQRARVARRLARLGAVSAGCGLFLWLAGFGWFAWTVSRPDAPPPVADGIVALTGGADRVATAFRLLANDQARQLLVSGVAPHADLADLAHEAGVDARLVANRTTLGYLATTTRGNAEEAGAWVRANDIHSLIVVTAAYHMPRALTELGHELPDIPLYPVRVTPPAMRRGAKLLMLRLLAGEYTKWLVASAGLTRLQSSSLIGPPAA